MSQAHPPARRQRPLNAHEHLVGHVPIRNFRLVHVQWKESPSQVTRYVVHKKDIEKFVKAFTELHYNPGVNPVNRTPTARILRIWMTSLEVGEYFWWSTPGLGSNDDTSGAMLIGEGSFGHQPLWEDPEVTKALQAADAR